MTDPRCLESKRNVLVDLEALSSALTDGTDEEREEAAEELVHYGLDVQELRTVRWLVSTGGPRCWFDFYESPRGDLTRVVWGWSDGTTSDTITLTYRERMAIEPIYHLVIRPHGT